MTFEISLLAITAATIGFLHTILGPDHYIPFVAISKARNWSPLRTVSVTILCGMGHIASSVLLGAVGAILGISLFKLQLFESTMGDLAAWALITFGLIYFIWGVRRAGRKHIHTHAFGKVTHSHKSVDTNDTKEKSYITPWVLFTIFVLGPCEPLIPILLYPAAQQSMKAALIVIIVFGLTTILTMVGMVYVLSLGIRFLPFKRLENYSHALAGAAVFLCGVAIQFGL